MLNRFFNTVEVRTKEKEVVLPPPEYKKYVINPVTEDKELTQEELQEKAKQIFQWAKANGATHYTFLAYPQTQGVCQKQDQFLDLKYFYENSLSSHATTSFKSQHLLKCEGDGSSFPSGGLRHTHSARAYMMWDTKSQIFLRKRNNVLYIPSILVSHDGTGLDDKTLFRKSEIKLEQSSKKLLKHMGINASAVYMALGLQQQFFIIPKSAYLKRLDIRSTGRALINDMPPRNQQFSDHYYGKMPCKVEDIFKEVERQLFQIGVPVKTRHKQVAINQFEFCPLYEEAGKAIDHNMITMEILKQVFDRHGYTVLLHEKPFINLNGSGKHANWSLNYIDQQGKPQNLFKVPREGTQKQKKLFKLFLLLNLQAIVNNAKLYLSSISTGGNQLRLGGHEAPPRIISAFLGDTVSKILDDKDLHEIKNFKNDLPNVSYDLFQQDTDRNRTSPYAFAGNKFQFRAVGSSQNVSFPMAVIAATITQQINTVLARLQKGQSIDSIIQNLTATTKPVRFQGNGYSEQWVKEARERGLYVNTQFYQSLENIRNFGNVFVQIGACNQKVVQAKATNVANLYINTVNTEYRTLQTLVSRQIIPRCFEYAKLVNQANYTTPIQERAKQFLKVFSQLITFEKYLNNDIKNLSITVKEAYLRRQSLTEICEKVNEVLAHLPKRESFPDLEDFMNIY